MSYLIMKILLLDIIEHFGNRSEVKFYNANYKKLYWRCLSIDKIQGVLGFIQAYEE